MLHWCVYFLVWTVKKWVVNGQLIGSVDIRSTSSWHRPMCLALQYGQILSPRSSSHFISPLRPGSDFHKISESSSLQTKRIRLLLEDLLNLLNFPLVDRSNVSTRSKLHLQPMTTRLFLSPKPFLLATALTNEISSFLYINQLGSISTSFWHYPLKSVRRKALEWISYCTPSSSSVPPNVFSSNKEELEISSSLQNLIFINKVPPPRRCCLGPKTPCYAPAWKYISCVAIGKLEWQVRNVSHCDSKQQQRPPEEITILLFIRSTYLCELLFTHTRIQH